MPWYRAVRSLCLALRRSLKCVFQGFSCPVFQVGETIPCENCGVRGRIQVCKVRDHGERHFHDEATTVEGTIQSYPR